jgi:hypothetical protein
LGVKKTSLTGRSAASDVVLLGTGPGQGLIEMYHEGFAPCNTSTIKKSGGIMDKQEMRDRLEALPKYIQRWLLVDRNQVQEGVIQTVLDAFRAVESPEPREGVETGLDFLGVLKEEGSNNGLWQLSMDLLDSEISSAVAALYEDDQVALLLPWVDDLDGLATDRDAKEWADILRQRLDAEWAPVLRSLVMDRVTTIDRW